MKRIILFLILIAISFFISIPEYVELNNLAIIEGIGVSYNDNNCTIYLKEIIPIKDEQGINYDHNYYEAEAKTFEKAYKKLEEKTKKKLYLKEVKFLVTNSKINNEIVKKFNIKSKNIYHVRQDVLKKLKQVS